MNTLIGMTDFVLEQGYNPLQNDTECWVKTHNYAKFLKQPLELWMFVPCDEDGNFLEEPILNPICCRKPNDDGGGCPECCGSPDPDYDTIEWSLYFQAKERCLFEGFEVQNTKDWIEFYGGIRVYLPSNDLWNMVSVVFKESEPMNKTIEYLVKYNLQLTTNAQKQLGI